MTEFAILVKKAKKSPRKGADNSETTRKVSLRHWRQEKVLPMKQDVTRRELNKCLHFVSIFLDICILTVFHAQKCDFSKTIVENRLKFSGCF